MKIFIVGILSIVSLATIPNINLKHDEIPQSTHQESSMTVGVVEIPPIAVEAIEQPLNKPELDPVKDNPNKCNLNTQHVWADFSCHDKPVAPVATPVSAKTVVGSGDCHSEILKYDWNHDVATAVMVAESGGNTTAHNFNHATKDNSWGCFQVNIYGANARNRPPSSELVKAPVNVAWAYNNYVANGRSFIGQWGVCRSKVSCY